MASKDIQKVIASSSIDFEKHVTIHQVEKRDYHAVIGGKPTDYSKLYVTFAVTDDTSFLGSMQKVLMLGASDDPAYPILLKAKPGDKGVMRFSVSEQITQETKSADGSLGCGSHIVSLRVEDFVEDGE